MPYSDATSREVELVDWFISVLLGLACVWLLALEIMRRRKGTP